MITTNEETVFNVFDKINKRELCAKCKADRLEFKDGDIKFGQYSNLSLGLISEDLSDGESIFDIMVVLESHGGTRKNGGFRPTQWETAKELKEMENYYLKENLVKFNQKEIRVLLNELDKMGLTYIITDLVKCFVKKGKDKDRIYNPNFEKAIEHCGKYLEDQILAFKPRVIVSLGRNVNYHFFNIDQLKHGDVWKLQVQGPPFRMNINVLNSRNKKEGQGFITHVIQAIFPSRNTADYWIEYGEWQPIIKQIKDTLTPNE